MGNEVIEHAESKFDVKNMLYTINKHGLFIMHMKCFCSIVLFHLARSCVDILEQIFTDTYFKLMRFGRFGGVPYLPRSRVG